MVKSTKCRDIKIDLRMLESYALQFLAAVSVVGDPAVVMKFDAVLDVLCEKQSLFEFEYMQL